MVRILIIEDELIISHDMTTMLTKMGYEVVGDAMDYDEAIDLLQRVQPDLILLDINLNGTRDGIDVAEEINRTYKIPFIFTTSYSDATTLGRAGKTNPVNYLVKPFTQEQLYAAIQIGLLNASNSGKIAAVDSAAEDQPLVIKGVLFVKDKFAYNKLVLDDIFYVKSDGNYLEVYTSAIKPAIIRASMGAFIDRLDENFTRCHKSYIINLKHITKFEGQTITVGSTVIPISKNYSEELMKRLDIF